MMLRLRDDYFLNKVCSSTIFSFILGKHAQLSSQKGFFAEFYYMIHLSNKIICFTETKVRSA